MNENEKITCAYCGEEHDRDDMAMTANGDMVCRDCLDEHYFLCEHCDEYHHNGDAQEVHCYRGYREVTEYWCPDCTSSDAYECDDCGSLIRRYDANWTDDEEEAFCDSCWRRRGADAIHQYGYKPDPVFACRARENGDTELKFGIELEVDCGEDAYAAAKAVTEAADGRIYCKRDGSLDNGFEIVTHPASLAYHLYDFRWANIMRICKQHGFKSHDTETCGLHIHVGRLELGADADERYMNAAKLVLLAYALRDELTKFSRRKAEHLDHWAQFPAIEANDSMNDFDLCSHATAVARATRYSAVNLQNTATVEFRIFRGTLKRDTLAASLQMVSNMCKYAMTHSARECLTANFVDVVNVDPTSVLLDYCQSRRLTTRVAS